MDDWKNFFIVILIVAVSTCVCSVLKFRESFWYRRIMGNSSSQNNSNHEKPKKKQSVAKDEKPSLHGVKSGNKKYTNEKKFVDKNRNNLSNSLLISLVEASTQTDAFVSSIKETLKLFAKQTQTDLGNTLTDSFVQTELVLDTFAQTDNLEKDLNNSYVQTDNLEKDLNSSSSQTENLKKDLNNRSVQTDNLEKELNNSFSQTELLAEEETPNVKIESLCFSQHTEMVLNFSFENRSCSIYSFTHV